MYSLQSQNEHDLDRYINEAKRSQCHSKCALVNPTVVWPMVVTQYEDRILRSLPADAVGRFCKLRTSASQLRQTLDAPRE